MTPDNDNELTSEPTLEIRPLREGLVTGVDNDVDLGIVFRAPQILEDGTRGVVLSLGSEGSSMPTDFDAELTRQTALAFRDVRLTVRTVADGNVELPSAVRCDDRTWHLPDIAWGATQCHLVRIHIPAAALPAVGGRMQVANIRIVADYASDMATCRIGGTCGLRVLTASDYDALPADELVVWLLDGARQSQRPV